jgi:hypothetical protein
MVTLSAPYSLHTPNVMQHIVRFQPNSVLHRLGDFWQITAKADGGI